MCFIRFSKQKSLHFLKEKGQTLSRQRLTLYRMSSVSDVALHYNATFVEQSLNTEVVQE